MRPQKMVLRHAWPFRNQQCVLVRALPLVPTSMARAYGVFACAGASLPRLGSG